MPVLEDDEYAESWGDTLAESLAFAAMTLVLAGSAEIRGAEHRLLSLLMLASLAWEHMHMIVMETGLTRGTRILSCWAS